MSIMNRSRTSGFSSDSGQIVDMSVSGCRASGSNETGKDDPRSSRGAASAVLN